MEAGSIHPSVLIPSDAKFDAERKMSRITHSPAIKIARILVLCEPRNLQIVLISHLVGEQCDVSRLCSDSVRL
jgi:hypothetical protein